MTQALGLDRSGDRQTAAQYYRGDANAAVDLFARAIAFALRLADAQRNLGLARHKLNLLTDAENSFTEALRLERDTAQTLVDLGRLAMDRSQWWQSLPPDAKAFA